MPVDRYSLSGRGDSTREDITDVIYNIDPTDRPFMSMIKKGTANNLLTEWTVQQLAAAGANSAIDGAAWAENAGIMPERVGVYCQISRKGIEITRRAEIVTKVGRKSEVAYQKALKGKELMRDVEFSALQNTATRIGATGATSSLSAGLPAWLRSHTVRNTGGTDPALSTVVTGPPAFQHGRPETAAGDAGAVVAMTYTAMADVVRRAWAAGGKPRVAMVSPAMKERFSAFFFTANGRVASQNQDQGTRPGDVMVAGTVDIVKTDFGNIQVVPNRWQRDRDVFILDPEYFEFRYLDGVKTKEMGLVGDSMRYLMTVDWGLCALNQASSGVIADRSVATAMVA